MSTAKLHPEATPDPRLLRWITPGREVRADCPELADLVADGTLQRVQTSPGEVQTLLSDDRSWSVDGPRVRSALFAALASPDAEAPISPEEMRRRIEQIIDREVAPVAGSHGGSITVESVIDGVVTVDFGGACAGCTLRGRTLQDLLGKAVQARYPQIRAVREAPKRRVWLSFARNGRR
ncbi:NifU family protein [Mycolicibacterium novocastrense]|uniref:NifU family protein n=1 Tax=Mycolicibacterium novocastrense TaxID=59813 RepID=A0AAW5STQ7_MYCNV|nr:NifU family protein [Mycolicibacterium novocastrense]MCV7026437.1 NifU family protein [Mycolicibacterium novocastrense]GAT08024.1 nitrogen-fixing NifU domain protein [Mycolicibacterium novocastrense]